MRNLDAETPPSPSSSIYRFSGLELDAAQFQLRRSGEPVHLEPKAFRVLLLLIENRHRAVPKDQILAEVWPDVAVTDNVLTRVIAQLRKALGDHARVAAMIETVPTVGYRFAAPVEELPAATAGQQTAGREALGPRARGGAPPPAKALSGTDGSRASSYRWLWAVLVIAATAGALWWATRVLPSAGPAALQPLPRQATAGLGLDATPSYSPDGANLVYASDRAGEFELYTRSLSPGGHEVRLTSDGGQNLYPRWSPDGKWIAYVSLARGGIFLIPALGGSPRRLTADGTQPVWMPDSSRLVYRSGRQSGMVSTEIYPNRPTALRVVSLDGEDREIASSAVLGGRPDSPAVSPDGRWILFACYRSVSRADLMAIRPDGTGLRPVFSFSRRLMVVNPVFHPGGKEIRFVAMSTAKGLGIYRADVDPETMQPKGEAREILNTGILAPRDLAMRPDGSGLAFSLTSTESTLYLVPLNSSGETTAEPRPLLQERNFRSTQPAWSPAGDRLAFSARRIGEDSAIWIAGPDGNGANPLSVGKRQAMAPSWDAGGRTLYFSSLESEASGSFARVVYAANLADKEVAERLRITGNASLPVVSPDGRSVAYHTQGPAETELFVHRVGDAAPRRLAASLRSPGYPVWLPDSSGLLVEAEDDGSTHIYSVPLDGGAPLRVTRNPGLHWPHSVGPGASRVAFASLREGTWNIWWIDRRSGEERKLTPYRSQRSFVRYPAWSPQGDRIVFEFSESKGNIYTVEWP